VLHHIDSDDDYDNDNDGNEDDDETLDLSASISLPQATHLNPSDNAWNGQMPFLA